MKPLAGILTVLLTLLLLIVGSGAVFAQTISLNEAFIRNYYVAETMTVDDMFSLEYRGGYFAAVGTRGGTRSAVWTVVINESGAEEWNQAWNESVTSVETGYAVSLSDTKVAVVGKSNSGGPDDGFVVKYNLSDGALDWGHVLNLPDVNNCMLYDVEIDDSGNVYALGRASTASSSTDWLVLKFDAGGAMQWSDLVDGPAHDAEVPANLILGSSNEIYVGGVINYGTYSAVAVAQYSPTGTRNWLRIFPSQDGYQSYGGEIAQMPSGDIAVLGSTYDDILGDYVTRVWVLKSDNSTWSRGDANFGSGLELPAGSLLSGKTGIAVGNSGNIYVAVQYETGLKDAVSYNIGLACFNSTAMKQWSTSYDNGSGTEVINALVVDADENLFFGGTGYVIQNLMYTVAYDKDGNFLDELVSPAPGNRQSYGYDLAITGSGHLVAAGTWDDVNTSYDGVLMGICNGCYLAQCFHDQEADPSNQCKACDVEEDPYSWTPRTGETCDDGLYCNGADTCDASALCSVHAGDPCADDGLWCNGDESCNESDDACESQYSQETPRCQDDGDFCNGDEICNEADEQCGHSGDPCESDGLWCNGLEYCDDTKQECVHTYDDQSNPRCPDDELYCNGVESCDEGTDSCVNSGDPCDSFESCIEESDECIPASDDDDVVDDDDIDDDDVVSDDDDAQDDDDTADTDDDQVATSGGDDDDDSGGCCG